MGQSFADQLDRRIRNHSGWQELEHFGRQLGSRRLDPAQLKVFLASTARFFREIPTGIVALALRVTDDHMAQNRFGAVDRGARILLAAVDEYGLHGEGFGDSHHKLFAQLVESLGVAEADLDNPAHIIPEARELARLTRILYRQAPVAAGVGFHFASEKTSDREFVLCYENLSKFASGYGREAGESDPQKLLNFYYIHTLVEPMHGSASAEAVNTYAESTASHEEINRGADTFMASYGRFWAALHSALSAKAA